MATAGEWKSLSGLSLHSSILDVLTNTFEFPTMTPVQATAIPPILSCKDVCVEAETGSGKTLSFLVPIAQLILFGRPKSSSSSSSPLLNTDISKKRVRAIVLLPTRELAVQVHSVAKTLFSGLPGDVVPVPLIGGAVSANGGAGPDEEYAADHRVIIATPGRLSAAVCSNSINCSDLDVLIMDEADRLLDMGFAVTVTDILTRLPKQRRTGMYSATQTSEVEALARAGMRNPVRVVVRVEANNDSNNDPDAQISAKRRLRIPISVQCFYDPVSPRHKLANLMQLLAQHPEAKVIVYFLTCACVEYFRRLPLEAMLEKTKSAMTDETATPSTKAKRNFFQLHGKMNQKRRERSLNTFAESDGGVLLCTDVAARGIDIADVDWVVQFDIPQDPDSYIHRVGRTGRLGRDGRALMFVSDWEDSYIEFLRVRKCEVRERIAETAEVEMREVARTSVQKMVLEATLADRAVLEASEKAFLSFVRAYKEHKCSYLLKLGDLDINSMGDSFGLLRLPRFYEFSKLKGKIEKRNKDGITIRDIGFKDKKREKKRQEDIREAIANRSKRREALQAKSKKKKKKRKRKHQKDDNGTSAGLEGQTGKRSEKENDDEEDDFSMEAMQLRKLKRGKLSVEQFDQVTGYEQM